jgi:hypothetical protein
MSLRDEFATFINAGTELAPDYVLLGEGITNASISYNPQTTDEVYIHQRSGTTEIDSYKPVMKIEAKHIETDEALEYLDGLRKTRPVGADAYSKIVNVWMYETPVGGAYPAEEQDISIQFDEFGGEGGKKNSFSCQLNYRGDPVQGTFNPTSGVFAETSA